MVDDRDDIVLSIIVVFFAFEYYKKYLGDMNVYKDLDFLWDLFSRKIPGIFDEGLNLIIIENVRDKVNLLCPNVSDSSTFYEEGKPVSFLLKDENGTLFEPIVFAKKTVVKKNDKSVDEIVDIKFEDWHTEMPKSLNDSITKLVKLLNKVVYRFILLIKDHLMLSLDIT